MRSEADNKMADMKNPLITYNRKNVCVDNKKTSSKNKSRNPCSNG